MYIYKSKKEEICSYVIHIYNINFLNFWFIEVITYSVKILL